jgi:predicted permease
MLGTLRPRVRRLFRLSVRRDAWTEADVDAELRLHVELRVEQLVASGWTQADAESEAHRRFGPSWDEAVRHLHRSGRAREERLAMRERLESVWQDVRYAVRVLRRSPRFAITAVLTLALGLGFTTVIFSLVDHIVLRPLSYAEPERLVTVREIDAGLREAYPTMPANASHFLEWRRACTACEGIAAIRRAPYTLTGEADPQRIGGVRVTANLFSLLGVQPALGRGFHTDDEQEGRDRVVVLSDAFWRRQFGADPTVIGRSITLSDTHVEVVGVLPRGFSLPTGDALGQLSGLPRDLDIYRPLALTAREKITTGEYDYVVLARLRRGKTIEQARAQLDGVQTEFAARAGKPGSLHASVTSMQSQVIGSTGRPLLLLLGAVGAVLLIVCVNLTNLSLARHAAREHESAVRVALGAGRGRLARLALAESVTLALASGALATLLARWALGALVALAPATLPRVDEVRLDGRVFGIAMLLTVLVGLFVGTFPAFRAGRSDPGEVLKAGGRGATSNRAAARRRALFIAAQVAFSTVLLVGAGLFLTSFMRVLRVERGFATERVLALDVVIPGAAYPTDTRRNEFYARALGEVSAIPGVTSAAVASALPLEGETWVNGLGRAEDGADVERVSANSRFVSPGYFSTIGTGSWCSPNARRVRSGPARVRSANECSPAATARAKWSASWPTCVPRVSSRKEASSSTSRAGSIRRRRGASSCARVAMRPEQQRPCGRPFGVSIHRWWFRRSERWPMSSRAPSPSAGSSSRSSRCSH